MRSLSLLYGLNAACNVMFGARWNPLVEVEVWGVAAADSSHVDTPLYASPSNVTAACIPVMSIIMLAMSFTPQVNLIGSSILCKFQRLQPRRDPISLQRIFYYANIMCIMI